MLPRKASGPGASDAHEARRGDQLWAADHRQDATPTPEIQDRTAALPIQGGAAPLTVYADRRALGFIRPLGSDRYEALDLDRRTLGVFATRCEAADAIEKAVSS
jgi:hypothetical protein